MAFRFRPLPLIHILSLILLLSACTSSSEVDPCQWQEMQTRLAELEEQLEERNQRSDFLRLKKRIEELESQSSFSGSGPLPAFPSPVSSPPSTQSPEKNPASQVATQNAERAHEKGLEFSGQDQFNQAKGLLLRKEYTAAEAAFQTYLTMTPDLTSDKKGWALIYLAQCQLEQKKYKIAQKTFQEARPFLSDPRSKILLLIGLAESFYGQNNVPQACKILTPLVKTSTPSARDQIIREVGTKDQDLFLEYGCPKSDASPSPSIPKKPKTLGSD